MDDLSTTYDFPMRDSIADSFEMDRYAAPSLTPRTTLAEALLDGLDAVVAVYEPARR